MLWSLLLYVGSLVAQQEQLEMVGTQDQLQERFRSQEELDQAWDEHIQEEWDMHLKVLSEGPQPKLQAHSCVVVSGTG